MKELHISAEDYTPTALADNLSAMPSLLTKIIRIAVVVALTGLLAPSAFAQYIWVANAGEDTVSKIDINSNTEVARYATWFTSPVPIPSSTPTNYISHTNQYWGQPSPWQGPAPSRIAQDIAGNVYVLDRFFSKSDGTGQGSTNAAHRPVLLKIAPTGSPTSTGPIALPIIDGNSSDDIDSGEAADARILWAKPIGGPADTIGLGRGLAIDKNGILWVGMYSTQQYYKVNSTTGAMIPPPSPNPSPIPTTNHKPYTCAVDINGKLWSVTEDDFQPNTLVEIDTTTDQVVNTLTTPGKTYSVAVFNDCTSSPPKVKVYMSERGQNKTYMVYDPSVSPAVAYAPLPPSAQFNSVAIAIDSTGYIISGKYQNSGRVIKTSQSGTVVWDTDAVGSTVSVADLHGIIVDANDDVWAVDLQGNQLIKYSGVDGHKIANVPVGKSPYTYGNAAPPTCNTPQSPPACAEITDKDIHCDSKGGYTYTFNVTNNTGKDVPQILLTPVQGSSFKLSQELFPQSPAIHDGKAASLTVKIGNVKPGTKVCFFVSLIPKGGPCCIVKVCPTLPTCGTTTPTRQGR